MRRILDFPAVGKLEGKIEKRLSWLLKHLAGTLFGIGKKTIKPHEADEMQTLILMMILHQLEEIKEALNDNG